MLTAEQVRFFDTFGFVVLRDVFSADELSPNPPKDGLGDSP